MTRDAIHRLNRLFTLALCAGVFLCVVMVGAAVRPPQGGASVGSRRWVASGSVFVETPTTLASSREPGHAPRTKRTWRRSTGRRTMRTLPPRAHASMLPELLTGVASLTSDSAPARLAPRAPALARARGAHAPTRAPPVSA